MDFVIGASAGMGACLFTNPLEVLKTKMQLQGELRAKGQHAVHYRNIFHSSYVIAKNDGLLALQKGLVPALWVQVVLNGVRLGFYQWATNKQLLNDKNGNLIVSRSVTVSALGAILGQTLSSPLFLVKTHLQAQSATASLAVGHQHEHTTMLAAFKNIYAQQGMKGLFRGVTASVPRAAVGSIMQLLSFDYSKRRLLEYDYFYDKKILTAFLASMAGGVAITLAMTPFDLIMTRIYNQPTDASGKGVLYTSYKDCMMKIYNAEGFLAFYKGVGPMYLRLGPHTVLCLVFWDHLNTLYMNFLKKV
ncbi:unnamed protein product [Phyllotreta striolata]|uniref:Solute carrier family 25 member 35 n=1 Tax=Phyllotreta striolata TaxID=444603 RepID=A0A9N9U2I9_PHYSR|nr:unnamed protein product [Phyllotreta striolata]